MTDSTRKDFSDKVEEKTTPNDSKSTVDKASEGISNTVDKAQRDLVSDKDKSTTQSVSDKASREKDEHTGDKSIVDKAKDAVGLGGK